jgi:WD40 repeat protein
MRAFLCLLTLLCMFLLAAADEPKDEIPVPDDAKPRLVLDTGGHTSLVWKGLFTPDSKQLITVSHDQAVRIWDVETGDSIKVLYPPRHIHADFAVLSPDGRRLAVPRTYSEKGKAFQAILVIGLPEGRLEKTLPGATPSVPVLAFSPDGKRLASGSDAKTISIWNLEKEEATPRPEKTFATKARPWGLAFSPDGGRLAQSGEFSGVMDVGSGKEVRKFFVGGNGDRVSWSPDGKSVAFATAKGLRLWDPAAGKQLALLHEKNRFRGADFSADSKTVLGTQTDPARAVLYDVASGEARRTFAGGEFFHDGHLSPDGKLAANVGRTGADHDVLIWQVADGELVQRLTARGWLHWEDRKRPADILWSSNNRGLLDSRGVSWKRASEPWNKMRTFWFDELQLGEQGRFDPNLRHVFQQKSLELKRDGPSSFRILQNPGQRPHATIAVAPHAPHATFFGKERVALAGPMFFGLFDANNGNKAGGLAGHSTVIENFACSPNQRFLATIAWDQVLCIHNDNSPQPLLSLYVSDNDWIVWTPEGYYAASPGGERLMGWVIDNGPNQMCTFHPASRFRARLFRPDMIKLVLQEGSVAKALKAADAKSKSGKDSKPVDLAQMVPPEVVVTTTPRAGTGPKDGKVKIQVEARAMGADPITSLQLLIDNRPYPGPKPPAKGEKGLITVPKTEKGPVKRFWDVDLPPGPHEIRVLARTEASLGTSRGMGVLAEEDKPGPNKQLPTLFVLAIGIDAYPGNLKLTGAVNDAKELKEVLEKKSKPPFGAIQHKVVVNEVAKKKGIIEGINWLKENMTPSDVAILFYAGHGALEGGEFYLLPQDVDVKDLPTTGLSRTELKEQMQGVPGRVLVLLDACHSAAIGVLFDDVSRELTDEDCGVVVMCASRPKEVALEKGGHGHLTRSVIDGLKGKASVSPRDKCVYLHHLQQFVIDNVEKLSNDTQHPTVVAPPWMRPFSLSKP